jgi:hypothetical protein
MNKKREKSVTIRFDCMSGWKKDMLINAIKNNEKWTFGENDMNGVYD